MTFPVFPSRPITMTPYHTFTCSICASDTHGQVHVHAGMAYKFNRDMHACFAGNYPEALSHCGQRSREARQRQSAFVKTASTVRQTATVSSQRKLHISNENATANSLLCSVCQECCLS